MSDNKIPRGFPRPRTADSIPIPWIAASETRLASVDNDRSRESFGDFVCQVCGLMLNPSEKAALAYNNEIRDIGDDHGLSHTKCAKITTKYCPSFRADSNGFVCHVMREFEFADAVKALLALIGDRVDDAEIQRVIEHHRRKFESEEQRKRPSDLSKRS